MVTAPVRPAGAPDDVAEAPPNHLVEVASPPAGGMHRSYEAVRPRPPTRPRRVYVSPRSKFAISLVLGAMWLGFSAWISVPWIDSLARLVSIVPAVVAVAFLAFIPGFIVAFLASSLLLDRQPPFKVSRPKDNVTVLVAARNEEAGIGDTMRYLASQDYDGHVRVILVDNGSTDATVEVARSVAAEVGLNLRIISESTPGKSHALNRGLAAVRTNLVVTVDADTLLHRSALRLLVARLRSSVPEVTAVAGSVLVRNSRSNLWTRLQEWDYFLGIASVKRMQGLFQTTLVAQGAFSLYRTKAVRRAGGWPDAIGEDIVLTWELMRAGGRIYYEPLAVAFTTAPDTARQFARQRARWARGMIEGLRSVPPWRQQHGFAKVLTAIDLVIPLLDVTYVFVWIPGLVLACFGDDWIVGPMTVAVLPVTLVVYTLLYRFQRRKVFDPLGLRVRRNGLAFFLFVVLYQMVMSTASVVGYTQQLAGLRRRWK
jgi:biofilm PGA synthesis N-glycosyltransferase PgaC